MKTLRNIILIVLCSVACDRNVEPFTPCMSFTAPWPLEWAQQTWACMNMPRPEDSHNYPIGLGLEESKVFQIPPCVLEKMSTQAVIQAIWEYPQFVGLLDGDRYQTNFDALFSNHHVYVELTKRKDAAAALLARLELVDPFAPLSQALAILMAQPVILTQLTDFEKKSVVAACVKIDAIRVLNRVPSSKRSTVCLLSGRIMLSVDYVPFVDAVSGNDLLERFLEGREKNIGNGILPLIINHSQSFSGECWNPSAPEPSERIKETWIGMNFPRPADSYNYPLYWGMPEWENATNEERLEAMQVPSCLLVKMSTQAVLQAIWEDFDIRGGLRYRTYRTYQAFIDYYMVYKNTWKELSMRVDAGAALLDRLELATHLVFPLSYDLTLIVELLFSQNVFLSQLDDQQKRKIVEVCLKFIDLRRDYDYFTSIIIDHLLIARTMYVSGYAPFLEMVNDNEEWKGYLDGYYSDGQAYTYMPYHEFNQMIEQFSINYLNENNHEN